MEEFIACFSKVSDPRQENVRRSRLHIADFQRELPIVGLILA